MPNLSELSAALQIDRHNLDEEIVQQSALFAKVSEAAALARSRLDEAKLQLDLVEAELDKSLREEAAISEEKITEKTISSAVCRHPDRVAAQRDYSARKLKTDQWEALREAFRQRNYMLRALCDLHIAGYYSGEIAGSTTSPIARARENRAEYNRQRMSERRQTRGST